MPSVRAGGQKRCPVPGHGQQDPCQQGGRHGQAALCVAAQLPHLGVQPGLPKQRDGCEQRKIANEYRCEGWFAAFECLPEPAEPCSNKSRLQSPLAHHPPTTQAAHLQPALGWQPCCTPLPLVCRKRAGGNHCLPQQRQQEA